MTKEEAIENLKWLLECSYVDSFEDAENEALDMAIKALESLDNIRAEIEQLPTEKCTETHRIYFDASDFKENVLAIFEKYKAESEDKG